MNITKQELSNNWSEQMAQSLKCLHPWDLKVGTSEGICNPSYGLQRRLIPFRWWLASLPITWYALEWVRDTVSRNQWRAIQGRIWHSLQDHTHRGAHTHVYTYVSENTQPAHTNEHMYTHIYFSLNKIRKRLEQVNFRKIMMPLLQV